MSDDASGRILQFVRRQATKPSPPHIGERTIELPLRPSIALLRKIRDLHTQTRDVVEQWGELARTLSELIDRDQRPRVDAAIEALVESRRTILKDERALEAELGDLQAALEALT
jgi:hypothetical protein